MSRDSGFLDYVVYQFIPKSGAMDSFSLSQAWWKTQEIEALARRLNLSIPSPNQF